MPSSLPDPAELERLLAFLRAAEALKCQTRTAWTSTGRRESVAEHTWRVCLMALVLSSRFPDVDFARLVKICIIHDLGEGIGGDVSAVVQAERAAAAARAHAAGGAPAHAGKAPQERADLLQLLAPLPAPLHDQILALWDEYEAAATPEARLAKALDKLETILQHNQGANPADFDYRFNLGYGRQYTSDDPLLQALRAIVDAETTARAEASGQRG